MAKIYVNLSEIRNANYGLPSLESKVDQIKRSVGLLRYRVAGDVAARYNIRQRLDDVYREADRLERQIDELYVVTNSCVEQYAGAEQMNTNNINAFN